jgi:general secretion pathway protein M
MRARLRALWQSRSPTERRVIAALAAVLAAAAYFWLVQSAERARAQLRGGVTALRAQAIGVDQQAAELERLRAAPPVSASPTDLRALVQARAEAAGLSRALVRIDAQDADRVVAVFGAVAFAEWLDWVAALESQQVRLEACRIEALSTPGLVSVTATLVRARAQ